MKFNRHEEDVRNFLAGKIESLITDRSGPRRKKGKRRGSLAYEVQSESGHQKRRRERNEAVVKFLAETALAGEFVAKRNLSNSPTSERMHYEDDTPSYPSHETGDSETDDTGSSGDEVISICSSHDSPAAPHYSPRKRNWHKRDIPSWSDDDQAVYEAICVHLNIGKDELNGKKAERASTLYRAVLARWRSVYKEADLIVSGIRGENVKKMLQRLKRDGDRFRRWLEHPSTAEHMADAMELYFLYPDRVQFLEDGSYAFVDADRELSMDKFCVFRPIEDDDDAGDDLIMNILKDRGILPPNDYSDFGAMMTYMEQFKLQKQAERDKWEDEHKEDVERMQSMLRKTAEKAKVRFDEELSRASDTPDLNTILGVKPSNLVRKPSPQKGRSSK